ncbi:lytic transglycosylase domain-containing protein [Goodfellowiella coeruleoviolacea]|uniref:Transglycosylase SLT domain-containing protein n=1 Tax=Goodfellowiella coeruleoviolacea TaxID=334858 RepID=A0AAE3G9Z6_9PSEU|nr:lytic transglycosylase domain-containing protein [Goodfellowiella coeruleoviolacea]MCP2163605.1 Transglycosylase SLT domain-containing protein [Goodfellowiella coeruleoviolacea]
MRKFTSTVLGVALSIAGVVGLGAGTASAGSIQVRPGSVPAQYLAGVQRAATTCGDVNAPLLAAQIEQESSWNPNAVSWAGAQGLAQFLPAAWSEWGRDADGDGTNSPFDPEDAMDAQGRYMCWIFQFMRDRGVPGDPARLALWGYNAGPWGTAAAWGNPPTEEARHYADRILGELIYKYRP